MLWPFLVWDTARRKGGISIIVGWRQILVRVVDAVDSVEGSALYLWVVTLNIVAKTLSVSCHDTERLFLCN